jgi:hypothetical protein
MKAGFVHERPQSLPVISLDLVSKRPLNRQGTLLKKEAAHSTRKTTLPTERPCSTRASAAEASGNVL